MSRFVNICLVVSGAALALGGCTTPRVTTDVNPNFSVANCHSYTFAREHVANADQPAAFGNPLNADRLRAAIEANMAAKGIARVDNGPADCMVGYALGTRQVFNDYYAGWGVGWGYGYGGGAATATGDMTVPGWRTRRASPWTCSMRARANPSGTAQSASPWPI